ncbi:Senescence regulator [Heracleum sosnowskyi]|uniref:Senescence regulator n=1 Tax=Heracleum sosnowskyi TaxID=360622 RepID=A0AAD8MJU6_9APIA|nr:Senescence regulator [Heracleum sosnowskyi]
MADQEFQECDILFEENGDEDHDDHLRNIRNSKKLKRKKKKKENSRPVNIPGNASLPTTNSSCYRTMDSKNLFEESYDDDAEVHITPPHVILGRRKNGKMAFSVCFGNGRTLKGRDLSQVRNSVLRMTGFYES